MSGADIAISLIGIGTGNPDHVTRAAVTAMNAADLILLPQPAPEEIESTLEILRLPAAMGSQFARMGQAEFLAVTRSRAVFLTVQATSTEMAVLRPR